MAKRHTQAQELLIQDLQSTYLQIQKVLPQDLAVINNPKIFPDDHKKDRRYNRAVTHAKDELQLLNFFLQNLDPRYRYRITSSNEFHSMITKILDIQGIGASDHTSKERAQALAFAMQMLEDALAVIVKEMPSEFNPILKETLKPFSNLIEALSQFARNNNINEIPQISIADNLQ